MTLRAVAIVLCALVAAPTARADAVDDLLRGRCARDRRLDSAARAGLAAQDPGEPLDADALRALAEHAGIPAPAVHVALVRGATDALRAEALGRWLAARTELDSTARCEAITSGALTSLALVPRLAAVAPMAHVAPVGQRFREAITVPEGGRAPTLLVASPDGAVTRIPITPTTEVRLTQPGEHTLQVTAEGPRGPLTWALWHVVAGGLATAAAAPREPIGSARGLVAAINALRRESGVGALRADPMLSAVAVGWARELARSGAVGHALQAGDSPVERLRRAHLHADRVAENAVRAPTLEDAHARLMASPSHRSNLLDPWVDAVGVGVVSTDLGVYAVELFAQHPALGP